MKRSQEEEVFSNGQLKRQLTASSRESGAGVVGGGGRNNGVVTGVTRDSVISYVNLVKDVFQDQREKYERFLDILKDFKAKRVDTTGVIGRVKDLFKGHPNLILGFNTFLPKGYEITLSDDEFGPSQTPNGSGAGSNNGGVTGVSLNEALSYVKLVKDIFQDQTEKYESFLDVLKDFRAQRVDTIGVIERAKDLFKGHPNLILGLNKFLPKGHEITLTDEEEAITWLICNFMNLMK